MQQSREPFSLPSLAACRTLQSLGHAGLALRSAHKSKTDIPSSISGADGTRSRCTLPHDFQTVPSWACQTRTPSASTLRTKPWNLPLPTSVSSQPTSLTSIVWISKRGHRFDRTVCVEMMEHVGHYESLLRKVASWMNPGGYC